MKATFRKTKSGKWAVMGPATKVYEGAPVVVTKKDGSFTTVNIRSVGKTFTVEGVQCRYGYEAEAASAPPARTTRSTRNVSDNRCIDCGGLLTDFDLRAASVHGYHFDCA